MQKSLASYNTVSYCALNYLCRFFECLNMRYFVYGRIFQGNVHSTGTFWLHSGMLLLGWLLQTTLN